VLELAIVRAAVAVVGVAILALLGRVANVLSWPSPQCEVVQSRLQFTRLIAKSQSSGPFLIPSPQRSKRQSVRAAVVVVLVAIVALLVTSRTPSPQPAACTGWCRRRHRRVAVVARSWWIGPLVGR